MTPEPPPLGLPTVWCIPRLTEDNGYRCEWGVTLPHVPPSPIAEYFETKRAAEEYLFALGCSGRVPRGLQLRRTRGWRMPPDAVLVSRPGPFGNPFRPLNDTVIAAEDAITFYEEWLDGKHPDVEPARRARLLARLSELRGKDLLCWCPLDRPCHRDVLLRRANPPSYRFLAPDKPRG